VTDAIGDILWRPSPERINEALVTRFRQRVAEDLNLELGDYDALYAWSVADPASFWRALWRWADIVGDGPGETTLIDGQLMPGARWFPEAKLNYAENLLQGADDDLALVFRGEEGRADQWTYGRLRAEVSRLAGALAADGVGMGDRVAGFLPNLPETVAAMLATASLGAVWSSCSPDFGVQGVFDRFSQIEPTVLFTADGYLYGGKAHESLTTARRLLQELSSVRRVVALPFLDADQPAPEGMTPWSEYGRDEPAAPLVFARVPFAHPLFIMFSSGTTGLPKCMVHSVGGTLLQHVKEHRLHCDLGPGDRLFYFTTCGWMMWNWLVSGLASGAAVMLYDGHPLQPEPVLWDYAADSGITHFGTSARYLAACHKAGLQPGVTHDLAGLRAVMSTGSPLAPDTFDYVYREIKSDLCLSSISGGTDILSCFALGSPVLPVRRGELQCRGLGMAVEVFDDEGRAVTGRKGELVCTAPFPSMPVEFWNDSDGQRYHRAYFDRFENIWCHGDFAELTPGGGMIIHGRSDTVLNPGGVRIGTAEIYRIVERFDTVSEGLVVGKQSGDDIQVILFVVLRERCELDDELTAEIRRRIRREASPRHVPAVIRQVPAIPRTISGKIVELAVRKILHGEAVENADALANPEALEYFRTLASELD